MYVEVIRYIPYTLHAQAAWIVHDYACFNNSIRFASTQAKKSEEEGKTELAEKKTKAAYILNVIGIIVACVTPILFVTIIPIIVYFVIINYA